MTKSIKGFYEELYKTRSIVVPRGMLGWLFVKLRRFELHRVDKALLLMERGNRLLDVGCGSGQLLIKARQRRLFSQVFGIDISSTVLGQAKRNALRVLKTLSRFHVRQGDIDKGTVYKSRYFDTISCIANLEHIFDPQAVIREINRLLKKNGDLILEVPNLAWLPRRMTVLIGRLPRTGDESVGWDSGHLHYFTFSSLEDLLKRNGFRIIRRDGSGIFSGVRGVYPELLSANIFIKARKYRNV